MGYAHHDLRRPTREVAIGDLVVGGQHPLADRKADEVDLAFDILQATGRRIRRPEVIACPTCGRLEIDLPRIVEQVETRLRQMQLPPLKISILGCIVNGVGEAREADLGLAAGRGKGVIFRRGTIVRHVLEHEMVDALLEEARFLAAEAVAPSARSAGDTAPPSCGLAPEFTAPVPLTSLPVL